MTFTATTNTDLVPALMSLVHDFVAGNGLSYQSFGRMLRLARAVGADIEVLVEDVRSELGL